jgi:hypothetical protein
MLNWKKSEMDQWIYRAPPDARFTLKIAPKGDGRWAWSVFAGTADGPMATGLANSLGAAKNTAEQLLKRIS